MYLREIGWWGGGVDSVGSGWDWWWWWVLVNMVMNLQILVP
jgi:hypothetical protein